MTRRDGSAPFTISPTLRAKVGHLLLVPEAQHEFYRGQVNDDLYAQLEGFPRFAFYQLEAIDRAKYKELTGREAPLNACRLLAGHTWPSPGYPLVYILTVAVLLDDAQAKERDEKAAEALRFLDAHLGDMATPTIANSKKVRDRFERLRDGKVFDSQVSLRKLLRLQEGLTPIDADAKLSITMMVLLDEEFAE
jgi:hypothetical protein